MKNIVATISFMFISFFGNAQLLFTENFENYTLGNLFTTVYDNTIPGQGGWYLRYISTNALDVNGYKITQESNKGKVLTLTTTNIPTGKIALNLVKPGIDAFINQRTTGNNVLKLEVDYYTGEKHNVTTGINVRQLFKLGYGNNTLDLHNNELLRFYFYSDSGEVRVSYNTFYYTGDNAFSFMSFGSTGSGVINLPFNTWVTYIVYLD